MRIKKTLTVVVVIFFTVSFANGNLTLTVNGLDASSSVEIAPEAAIIISVSGPGDTNESYSVICETGGTLAALSEPNVLGEIRYLFTRQDEGLGLAKVDLTVGEVLDYQLVFFLRPDANTVVFGIDSDCVEYTPQQPAPQQLAASQAALPVPGGEGMVHTMEAMDCNEVLDPIFYPNLNNDPFVNFEDFAILAANWLASGTSLDGDLNGSERVDLDDLAILTYHWLANACGPSPEEVFDSFKNALSVGDVNTAVTFFTEVSAENYRIFFDQLSSYLPQMVNDMGELIFIEQTKEMAIYDLLREQGADTYGYPVIFVRDEMGQWKISDF